MKKLELRGTINYKFSLIKTFEILRLDSVLVVYLHKTKRGYVIEFEEACDSFFRGCFGYFTYKQARGYIKTLKKLFMDMSR